MTDEKLTPAERELLRAPSERDRNYRPAAGPDEPTEGPPGRASASHPTDGTVLGGNEDTESDAVSGERNA